MFPAITPPGRIWYLLARHARSSSLCMKVVFSDPPLWLIKNKVKILENSLIYILYSPNGIWFRFLLQKYGFSKFIYLIFFSDKIGVTVAYCFFFIFFFLNDQCQPSTLTPLLCLSLCDDYEQQSRSSSNIMFGPSDCLEMMVLSAWEVRSEACVSIPPTHTINCNDPTHMSFQACHQFPFKWGVKEGAPSARWYPFRPPVKVSLKNDNP